MEQKVNNYYLEHFVSLHFSKQFHFASRLWLWTQDPQLEELLRSSKQRFCGANPPQSVETVLAELIAEQTDSFGTKNAAELRAPYFAKYPLLRKVLPLLFRLLFIETVYGINARDSLAKYVNLDEIDQLAQTLFADAEACAILSTHAANFLYLWNRFYKHDEAGFDVDHWFEIAEQQYDLTNKTHLQLYIYLYTHCIIGESLFYKRAIPSNKLVTYLKMAKRLDAVVADNFKGINLDNKFEILVAQQICGYQSKHRQAIYDEAAKSFSSDGDFVIDQHNNNAQTNNIDFEKSEHRNVLLIMAHRTFSPTTAVVS